MPKPQRKIAEVISLPKKITQTCWFLFSQGKEHCFKEEISRGLFSNAYRCGCKTCCPQAFREYHAVETANR